MSMEMRSLLERIIQDVEYVELASYQAFATVFSKATLLRPEMPQ
jgi:hypothetical protein